MISWCEKIYAPSPVLPPCRLMAPLHLLPHQHSTLPTIRVLLSTQPFFKTLKSLFICSQHINLCSRHFLASNAIQQLCAANAGISTWCFFDRAWVHSRRAAHTVHSIPNLPAKCSTGRPSSIKLCRHEYAYANTCQRPSGYAAC